MSIRVRVAIADEGVFVATPGKIRQYDPLSLAILKEIDPPDNDVKELFLAVDQKGFWLHRPTSPNGRAGNLLQLELYGDEAKEVTSFRVETGYEPLADDGERIWIASTRDHSSPKVYVLDKLTGEKMEVELLAESSSPKGDTVDEGYE